MDELTDFFGPPIHVYTRADALADGVLFDCTLLAQRNGFRKVESAAFTVGVEELLDRIEDNWRKVSGLWIAKSGEVQRWVYDHAKVPGLLRDKVLRACREAVMQSAGADPSILDEHPDRVYFDFCHPFMPGWDVNRPVTWEPAKLWARVHPGDDGELCLTVMLQGED